MLLYYSTSYFILYLSYIIGNSFHRNDEGVNLKTRYDGRLFNIFRPRSKTKVKESTVHELLFANNAALIAHSGESLRMLFGQICTVMQEFWARDKFEENSDDAPGILKFEF